MSSILHVSFSKVKYIIYLDPMTVSPTYQGVGMRVTITMTDLAEEELVCTKPTGLVSNCHSLH